MKHRLLFIGATGRARAPIAAGLARVLAGENASVEYTAVSAGEVHPLAQQVMEERGITAAVSRLSMRTSQAKNWDYVFVLCEESAPRYRHTRDAKLERIDWFCLDPMPEPADDAACLCHLRAFRDDMDRKVSAWLGGKNLLATNGVALQRVWRELARYEHPLFTWNAVPAGESVEIRICFRPPAAPLHDYAFQMRPRELENPQFPWLFQKQLYDCLHDYVVELFSRNPQQDQT